MAIENIFIASAVTTTSALGMFLYLFHMSKGILKEVWLTACFLTLLFSFAALQVGYGEVIVKDDMEALSFDALLILMWSTLLLLAVMFLRLMMFMLKALMKFATGKGGYDREEETI